jgi:DNA-binding MarR family transcriptional regulator
MIAGAHNFQRSSRRLILATTSPPRSVPARAAQAFEGTGIGADLDACQMVHARPEWRDPGRGGVVGVGRQTKADQHDDEARLGGEETSLGRRPPMSVVTLAEAVGMDKGQISRALAGLVSRKLVCKAVNPRDNREVLVGLTRAGLIAHDAIVAGALERNRHLLEQLDKDEVAMPLGHIDRLIRKAEAMLEREKQIS